MTRPLRYLIVSSVTLLSGAVAVAGLVPVAAVSALPSTAPLPGVAAPAAVRPVAALSAAQLVRDQISLGLDCTLSRGDVPLCLHGEDGAPDGVEAASGANGTTGTTGEIGCYGNGNDGRRVRAVYARPQGSPDRYAESLTSIRGWAAGVSAQFDESAIRTGGRRHVRYATTPGPSCTLVVLSVTLPDAAFGSFKATVDALEQRGLKEPYSKYLVWADTDRVCGLATSFVDDSPGLDNLNNGSLPSYARIDRRCWGKVETHELVHMLGGVQSSATNGTAGFHCSDGLDVMCYDDRTAGSTQRAVCGKERVRILDCRNDDYFSTSAPRGSYLQTHWNTARSSFLAATLRDPAAEPAPRSSPSPSASPEPSRPPEEIEDPLPVPLPAVQLPAGIPTLLPSLLASQR
ncbi:MAG: hypothetical protein EPN99_02870 [Frankiales bacterium]|nr:MAG: hypothetical protein EPN99_02870 [Frankiales bacterium]